MFAPFEGYVRSPRNFEGVIDPPKPPTLRLARLLPDAWDQHGYRSLGHVRRCTDMNVRRSQTGLG